MRFILVRQIILCERTCRAACAGRKLIMVRKGIAVGGTILTDNINNITAYPEEGELTYIRDIKKAVGGCVPNVATDVKKICPEICVRAIGKVGDDADGAFIKSVLRQNGVDVTGLKYSAFGTSKTEVMSIAGGQRTFFTYPGANDDFGADDIDFDGLDCGMFHLGYFLLLKKIDEGDGEKILDKARRRGIKTSVDLVSVPSGKYDGILRSLKYVDNLIINETEAGMLTGIEPKAENLRAVTEKLLGYGVKERVIVHIPEAGVITTNKGFTAVPSLDIPDEQIAGSTGAGDAFCAGALIGIYKGYPDEDILKLASSVAATSLRVADATSGIMTEEDTVKYCERYLRRNICL